MNTEAAWRDDGWAARLRLGLVVPHADIVPEAECQAMGGAQLTVHGTRLKFAAMRAGGEMDPQIPHAPVASFTQPPLLDEVVGDLAEAPLQAIGLAFTSSAYLHGPGGERALIARLEPRSGGVPVVSTCLAAERALAASGARTLAIVNPPWFDAALDAASQRYFEEAGFTVVHHAPAPIESGQRHVTPPRLGAWVLEVVDTHAPEAVFIAGNGQRAVGIVDAVERSALVTVLAANQVLLWAASRAAGVALTIEGYGRLFSLPG